LDNLNSLEHCKKICLNCKNYIYLFVGWYCNLKKKEKNISCNETCQKFESKYEFMKGKKCSECKKYTFEQDIFYWYCDLNNPDKEEFTENDYCQGENYEYDNRFDR